MALSRAAGGIHHPTGSGGAGQWRGGDGAIRRIQFREPMAVSTLTGHRRVLAGGSPGGLRANRVHRTDGSIEPMASSDSIDVQPGDVLVIDTPGGGGYGSP